MPTLPVPEMTSFQVDCQADAPAESAKKSSHMDSTLFFSGRVNNTDKADSVNNNNNNNIHGFEMEPVVLFADLNLETIKILFLVLDVLLVLYRTANTYLVALKLCHGLGTSNRRRMAPPAQYSAVSKRVDVDNIHNNQLQQRESHYNNCYNGGDTLRPATGGTARHASSGGGGGHLYASIDHRNNSLGNRPGGKAPPLPPPPAPPERGSCSLLRGLLLRLAQHPLVPRVLLGMALLTCFYLLVTFVCHVMTVSALSNMDGFRGMLNGVHLQVNQTNEYLRFQAKHFTKETARMYESNMHNELLELEGFVQYFNNEQRRLSRNYVREACEVKQALLGNHACDVAKEPSKLLLPALPCRFLPLRPDLYEGSDGGAEIIAVAEMFEPYLVALRNLVIKLGYVALVTVGVMAAAHALGAVVFHYVRTRQIFPMKRFHVTSPPVSYPPRSLVDPTNQSEEESDNDQSDGGFRSYNTHVTLNSQQTVSASPQHPQTKINNDYSTYTETKV